jgi:serine/threonine-protein kinase
MSHEDAAAWAVGRYTIHGELASGGMATVHIGRMGGDAGFNKLVAVKRMHPQFAKDPDFLAMFLDEARLAARIRHPNVVQPLDVIVEGSEVLLVMEYVHGEALSRLNRALRPLHEKIPLRIAVAIMAGVLHGLHAAHEAKSERGEPLGIVHRDMSPQNIIVGTDGVARVLDFGIAKAADQVHMTRDGELKGKLVYMAPEQLLGESVTRRSDIFSTAIVVWECLTGQRLFESDSSSPLAARTKQQKIDRPSEISPEVPPALDEVVLKGLALAPENRWATAREMALALEEAVPPATHTQVAAWVEKIAHKALAERTERIAAIEAEGADSSQSIRKLAEDLASDRLMTRDVISQRSLPGRGGGTGSGIRPLPLGGDRVSNTPAPRSSTRGPAAVPQPPDAPRVSRPPEPRMSRPPDLPPPPPGPPSYQVPQPISQRDAFYVPPAASDPLAAPPGAPAGALAAPSIPTTHAAPAKTTVQKVPTRGRGAWLFVLFGILIIAALVSAPFLAKRNVQASLQAEGIHAEIDEVDLLSQIGSMRLVGATFTSPDVPGVTVHAKEVVVALDGNLSPTAITLRDADVSIDASYNNVLDSLDGWAKKHATTTPTGFPDTLTHLRIESAHVKWSQISGAGTIVEAKSLVLDMPRTQGRPLGADFMMNPTSVNVTAWGVTAGPWLLDVKRDGKTLKAHLAFDQTQPMTYFMDVSSDEVATTVDLRVPKAKPSELGLKPESFGGTPTDAVVVDATLHAVVTKDKLDASGNTTVEALRAPNGPPGTFSFDARLSGPRTGTELLEPHFALGLGPSVPTGKVVAAADGISLKLTVPLAIKCDEGARSATVTVSLDSRNLGAATVDFAPRACVKK